MSGLFGILGIAERGMSVASLGLRTTGHNIANVNTEGYSRQRQISAADLPLANANGHLGTGVEQITIERITDTFIQQQLMRQGGALGSSDTQAQALAQIQEVFNEQKGPGLSAALNKLYDAFQDISAATTPGAPVEREALRSAATSLIDTLHSLDSQLRFQQQGANTSLESTVNEINLLSQHIDRLNEDIVKLEVTAPANDLRDQRELALRQLSELVDIHTFEDSFGRTTVVLGNGLPLVEGESARSLVVVPDPGNPFNGSFFQVHHQSGSLDADVTGEIGSGRLGGLLRARDTLIPSAIRSLDTIAYNLATGVNAVHAAGTGLDGSSGDFFLAPAGVEDSARDIALAPRIAASTDAIAAGLSPAPSDNRNALALAALRDARSALFLPGDPPGPASGPNRNLLEHASALVSDIGLQAATLQTSSEQQSRILENLESRREAVSGVSLDEETTRLIELQAAFQANARIVSVLDTLLDDVLSMI